MMSVWSTQDTIVSEKYRTNPFYNGVSTFRAAFPDVADAIIEWRERRGPEDEKAGELKKTGFKRGNFTQGLLPCSNPACHEGGYEVDKLVASMLRLEETEREGMMLCAGREIAEESRRGPVRCPHRIMYKATVSMRTGEDDDRDRNSRRSSYRRGRGRPQRRKDVA
jgi:hypothetical protein